MSLPADVLDPEVVPSALRERSQWVCWQYLVRGAKQTKCPMQSSGAGRASSTDPSTWSSFEEAIDACRASDRFAGVGFVFTPDDPFTGVDLDDCIDENGGLVASAQEIVDSLNSYTEISPSGRGVKVFIVGAKAAGVGCRTSKVVGFKQIEMYSSKRFFTITGRHVASTPLLVEDCQSQLDVLCSRFWRQQKRLSSPNPALVPAGFEGDDNGLIEQAFAARSGDRFRRLWSGDTSGHADDDSAADLALCNMLAFWTGRDAERMDRLFRRSGLYREKWDQRRGDRTYGQMTIHKAIDDCSEVYSPHRRRDEQSDEPLTSDAINEAPEEEPEFVAPGQRDPDSDRLVLSPRRSLPTAEAYIREFHQHVEGRTLYSYAGLLLEWRENRYRQVENEAIKHRLQPWLHKALRYIVSKRTGLLELVDFESNPATVKQALDTIQSFSHLPATTIVPSWLGDRRDRPTVLEILPCKTANVHIPTGGIIAATPTLFTINALDFDYDPNAESPERWIRFLKQLWEDDLESIGLLQEWFGYCLTADTTQQKMLLLVGPRRSGKGTIGRVLTHLVGAGNVVGPTTSSLAGAFGLQPLIDKSLAIVSDARFKGESVGAVVERLLCVSGEDTLTIDRKFLGSVSLKLPTRFMFLTNELPRLNDVSTALAGRFLVLRLSRSFYGQEDIALTRQLLAELPGVLLWAIEGWKRLNERGCFLQPASSQEAICDLEDLASPVSAFLRQRCVVSAGRRAMIDDLYQAWQMWCEQDGRTLVTSKQTFGRDLTAAAPGIKRRRGTGMTSFYEGIGLEGAVS